MWSDNETAIDSLNVQHVVNAVLRLLDLEQLSPVTIGVYGDWGSGKSSVAAMLRAELQAEVRSRDTLCIVFNGWRFEGYEDAKSALMTTVLEELGKHKTVDAGVREAINNLVARVNWLRVGSTVGRYALHAGLAVATGGASVIPSLATESTLALKGAKADEVIDAAKAYVTEADDAKKIHDTVREFEQEFADLLKRTKLRRLVVIIDDLDRCNPTQIIETLEAIRLFLAVPSTAFIIAADDTMVQNAARLRFPGMEGQMDSLGRDYLEKMVQIPVRVPPLGPRDVETYLNMLFLQLHLSRAEFANACAASLARAKSDIGFRVTASNAHEIIGKALTEPMKQDLTLAGQVRRVVGLSVDGNPRQIKRFLNAFRLRLILAEARNVTLDPRVAAKLMLLEYFRIEALRTIARWQAAHDGKAIELAAIEVSRMDTPVEDKQAETVERAPAETTRAAQRAADSRPTTLNRAAVPRERTRSREGQDVALAVEGTAVSSEGSELPLEAALWDRDDWMRAWLESEPKLGDHDLSPYFYFARDRLGGGSMPTQRMSPKAREVLVQLLNPSKVVRDRAAAALKDLLSTDVVAMQETLAERVRTSDTLEEGAGPLQALMLLVAERHELVAEFASIMRSLPVSRISAGTPNRLLLAAGKMEPTAKAVIVALLDEWQRQGENSTLANSARMALTVKG